MFHNVMRRGSGFLVILSLLAGLLLYGCGGGGSGGTDRPPAGSLTISSRAFPSDTGWVRYTLEGDGLVAQAMGTWTNQFPTFPVTLARVPEGQKTVRAYGYKTITPTSPDPSGFPSQFVRDVRAGGQDVVVVGNKSNRVEVGIISPDSGSDKFGVERELLNADYKFIRNEPYAGLPDGSNITKVVIDHADAETSVTITQDMAEAVGLFQQLPFSWPNPDWFLTPWPDALTVTTDANGDAWFYLVAKPGKNGRDVILEANGAGLSSRRVHVRLAGVGVLEAQSDPPSGS